MDTPPLDQTVPHDELARCLQGLCKVASDGLTGVLGVAGCPGWPGPAGGAGAPGRGGCFRLGGGGLDEPGRRRWTVSVVPAQVATTALDRCCRPDDSTHYFAVVGRRARSQASARSNLPKPLKP